MPLTVACAALGIGLVVLVISQLVGRTEQSETARDAEVLAPQLGESEPDGSVSRAQNVEESAYAQIAEPLPTPTPGPLRPTTHVVEAGETILLIADRFGLRPESILWANDLPDPDLIVVGQKLIVPPTDGLIYSVEPGDSLGSIARRYGIDLFAVASANGLSDLDQLPTGTELVLPGARPVAPSRVLAAGPNSSLDAVGAPSDATLAALTLEAPLPDNIGALLSAAWLRTRAPNALHAGPEPSARRHASLPAGVRVERVGDLAGRRIPVRDPGDGRTRQAMSGWIEADDLEPAAAPGPRELPRAYPADTRMDISHTFVPYRGQLDGAAYALANCGPTSVGMVLESFGVVVSQATLRAQVLDAQRIWGNGTGTLITALAQVVERHGLTVHDLRRGGQIHRWSLDDVRAHLEARHPILVQVRYRALPGREAALYYGDHYIVLTGVLDDGFLYNDPIDHDGLGWDRIISGQRLARAMDTSDRRYVQAAFAVSE